MMFEKRFRIFLISTHALTEGDFGVLVLFEVGNIFQLTPSRRATIYASAEHSNTDISTHALTEGDDGRQH